MLIIACGPIQCPRHARKARAERKKGRFRQPEPSPDAKGAPAVAGTPGNARLFRQRSSYFAACLRAERTAASMALLVTVAPATPSIWALWAASTCWA